MNHPRFPAHLTVLAGLLAAATLAHAQPGTGGPQRDNPLNPPIMQPTPSPNPLARVGAPTGRTSLVERHWAGKIKRLAASPASAALGKLPLSAVTAAAVTSIQQSESSSWDTWVRANLAQVMGTAEDLAAQQEALQQTDATATAREKEYQEAKATADAKAAANDKVEAEGKAKREAKDAAKQSAEGPPKPAPSKVEAKPPSTLEALSALLDETPKQTVDGQTIESPRTKGGLAGQLTGALAPDEALAMNEMVREYFDTCVAERIADSKASGKEMTVAEATSRELLESMGAEFKRSFDRTADQAAKMYDRSSAKLGLTSAQSNELLPITGASFEKSLQKATPTERVRMFSKMYQLLTPEQRETLLKQM